MTYLDAFVFAAGLGTRMGPLSAVLPKPAWTINGKPLLQWATGSLRAAGCNGIACNAHCHTDIMMTIANEGAGAEVIHEDVLLGTGEPLRRLSGRIGPHGLLVWNADVIANVPWAMLSDSLSTRGGVRWLLVPHPGGPWAKLYMDPTGRVLPRGSTGPNGPYLFTGAARWSSSAAGMIPKDCFDVRDFLASYEHHYGVVAEPFEWLEIGTPGQLIHAANALAPSMEGRIPGCYIHPTASLAGNITGCILGPGAELGADIEDSGGFWFIDGGRLTRLALQQS